MMFDDLLYTNPFHKHEQAFALIIAVIGLILAIVATSLDSWARQEVLRQSQNSDDSHTLKTQGLATRCITYVLSDEVLALQLPIEDLPQSQCIGMSGLNCSGASSVLLSAHDVLSHEEIQNSNSMVRCNSSELDLINWLINFSYMYMYAYTCAVCKYSVCVCVCTVCILLWCDIL